MLSIECAWDDKLTPLSPFKLCICEDSHVGICSCTSYTGDYLEGEREMRKDRSVFAPPVLFSSA